MFACLDPDPSPAYPLPPPATAPPNMVDTERTASSFYSTSPSWQPPASPNFSDPFAKINDQFSLTLPHLSKDTSKERAEAAEASYTSSASTRPSSHSTCEYSSSRPSPLASSLSSPAQSWQPHSNNSATASSSSPSPLASRRTSSEGEGDPDTIQVSASPLPCLKQGTDRRSVSSMASSINRLCIQLKSEHIMFEEVTMGQLLPIQEMKEKLNDLLPPFSTVDSPVMGHEMSIRILQSRPHDIIRGTILLETRKAVWKKHSKVKEVDTEAQSRPLPDLSGVDAWELPVDGSSLLDMGIAKGGKKTFEFPQYRVNAACKKCKKGSVDCKRCCGLDAVECFWCASSGYFKGHKCKKCNTTGMINCVKCNNTGRVTCTSCEGKGAFRWALCVDLKMDSLSLPPITLNDLLTAEEKLSKDPLTDEFIKSKATQAIYETALQIFENSVGRSKGNAGHERRVPVLASCQIEKHMVRLLHVSRWQAHRPSSIEHTRFRYTTDSEDNLTQLPFKMDKDERRLLQQLDEREQQRLGQMPSQSARNMSLPHLQHSSPMLLTNQLQRGSV